MIEKAMCFDRMHFARKALAAIVAGWLAVAAAEEPAAPKPAEVATPAAPAADAAAKPAPVAEATPTPTPATAAEPKTKAAKPAGPAPAASASGPEFCQTAMQTKRRDPGELIDCIRQERNPDRFACMEQALCSGNPNLRGEVVRARLSGMKNIAFEVLPGEGDKQAADDLARLGGFGARELKWDEKGTSFHGNSMSMSGYLAAGQVVGGQLSMDVMNSLTVTDEKGKEDQKQVMCTVSVKLNKELTGMDGTARCKGLRPIFRASFGFG